MSDVGAQDRDLSVDSGIRGHIEAAVAHHRLSPDTDFIATTIAERDGAIRRAREDGKEVRDIKDLKPEEPAKPTSSGRRTVYTQGRAATLRSRCTGKRKVRPIPGPMSDMLERESRTG